MCFEFRYNQFLILKIIERDIIKKMYIGLYVKYSSFLSGHAVAQLVEALRYKTRGRGFESRWCHWDFHWQNPSGRTMALGLTQPLTQMSTRNVSWG